MKKPTRPKFKDVTYSSRKFLNKKTGLAAIEAYIDLDKFDGGINASFDMSDCNRKISLDFYIYDYKEKSINDKLNKVELLIDELLDFRLKLNEFIELGKERRAIYDAYAKELAKWKKENPNKEVTVSSVLEDL